MSIFAWWTARRDRVRRINDQLAALDQQTRLDEWDWKEHPTDEEIDRLFATMVAYEMALELIERARANKHKGW